MEVTGNLLQTKAEELFERFNAIHDYMRSAKVDSKCMIKAKMSRFNNLREQLVVLHEEILQYNSQVTDQKFKIKFIISNFDDLCDVIMALHERILPCGAANKTTDSAQIQERNLLKPIEMPTFRGDIREWSNWHGLFDSLVHNNNSIPAIQKFFHLRTALSGEPLDLIANYGLTEENYQLAYSDIIDRYTNPRRQLNFYFSLISHFKPSPVGNPLSQFLKDHVSAVKALKALDLKSADLAESILFQLCYENLGKADKFAFDSSRQSKAFPSTGELFDFLQQRVKTGELLQDSTQGARNQKIHHAMVNNTRLTKNQHIKCPICSASHGLPWCPVFKQQSPSDRWKTIQKLPGLCRNCLRNHSTGCPSKFSCFICQQRHHTLLHENGRLDKKPEGSSRSSGCLIKPGLSGTSSAMANHAITVPPTSSTAVLLATALINVSSNGMTYRVRALIDPGSELSLISEHLVQTLRLNRTSATIPLSGVGAKSTGSTRGIVSLCLSSIHDKHNSCTVRAFILPKLTALLPTTITTTRWQHIDGLQLADPSFHTPGRIDLILGADIYSSVILNGVKKGHPNAPLAQSTIFGWILSGPIGLAGGPRNRVHHCKVDETLNKLVAQFWRQEEADIESTPVRSPDDEACENHFVATHRRNSDGRYVVRLPFRNAPNALGESCCRATKMVESIVRKIDANREVGLLYRNFMADYELLGHMDRVLNCDSSPALTYYIPHHGVFRESEPTKIRVVFNASATTTSGISLNDLLYTGEKLQKDIREVLLYFRRFKYCFAADVEKMYRQILMHEDDRDFQRIIWSKNGELVKFRLNTVTYGTACAPFQALRVFNQLIQDEGSKFPLASTVLDRGRYVDDVFGGADTVSECKEIINQTIQLCNAGGFPLKKWISNTSIILSELENSLVAGNSTVTIDSSIVRTLGLQWKPDSDWFHFYNNFITLDNVTKRTVLSRVAQIFDPLGFISPIIVSFKIFIQELWIKGLDWDQALPSDLLQKWRELETYLQTLHEIKVPRFLGIVQSSALEIHGFSDASNAALGAVIYFRVQTCNEITTRLVVSKTKVAPLRKMTIPRLELSAAALLIRLVAFVLNTMTVSDCPIILWTDSSAALTWITSHSSRWKDFVGNRVQFIQEKFPNAKWRYVPGKQNPADFASRGLSPQRLSTLTLWWNGPDWLKYSPDQWPCNTFSSNPLVSTELRSTRLVHVVQHFEEPELLRRFSTLNKLSRITAWCRRFIDNTRHKMSYNIHDLCLEPNELRLSLFHWVRIVQNLHFPTSIGIGTLVLVVDERYPPSKWPLARVIDVHPGSDDLVRVVTVRTATGSFRRPISKLCPLPC